KTVDLISSPRKSVGSLQGIIKALAAKARIPSLKSFFPCSSPRNPYILAPRSVYAFTLLPLSRHSIKMEIFHFSRFSQLSSKLPYLSAET
ncbi:hypothetical protein IGI04_036668, partial [Brassica rapa subsp. trilocularis]